MNVEKDLIVGDEIITLSPNKRTGDRSWVGEILIVKALELPIIVVNVLSKHKNGGYKGVILDTNEHEFKKPSQEYINAVLCRSPITKVIKLPKNKGKKNDKK